MTSTTDDLMALDLEVRLTIAYRLTCECASYLVNRREVLLPEVLKAAEAQDEDPVDLFAQFARGVHERHLSGLSLAASA